MGQQLWVLRSVPLLSVLPWEPMWSEQRRGQLLLALLWELPLWEWRWVLQWWEWPWVRPLLG